MSALRCMALGAIALALIWLVAAFFGAVLHERASHYPEDR